MIKCRICADRLKDKDAFARHIEDEHQDQIPEDFTSTRYAYFLLTGKKEGHCVECKKPTEFNDLTFKYNRFCKDPACKQKYAARFKKRMVGKYGKVHLLNDPTKQREMLENRSISKEYEWSNGEKMKCVGSYEYDFLKFLDLVMNYSPSDIMAPSPHTYFYIYEGKEHFYIPDFFIPTLNLEVEVKDGGDNPNTHHKIIAVDKEKEKLKDAVLSSVKNVKYIKVVNKEYDTFLKFLINEKNKAMGVD
ncbi:MAG: hypothetical protein PHF63_00700 [Herbinix sp.]|nr:hypothetical protein [Herbinix sp.]